jgi:hypothetical protein
LIAGVETCDPATVRWSLPVTLGAALVASATVVASTVLAQTTMTQVSATTTTTIFEAIGPPVPQQCVAHPELDRHPPFHCQFHACVKACARSEVCRHRCAQYRHNCILANGCDVMPWPFCAGGSWPPCGSPGWSSCVQLHLVNRTSHTIDATSVDGVDLGISLPPGGEADASISGSRSGATVGALAAAAGGSCEWRVILKGCLEVLTRHRIVFRQHAASCAL